MLCVAPNSGSELPGSEELVVFGRPWVIQLVDETGERGGILGCEHNVERERRAREGRSDDRSAGRSARHLSDSHRGWRLSGIAERGHNEQRGQDHHPRQAQKSRRPMSKRAREPTSSACACFACFFRGIEPKDPAMAASLLVRCALPFAPAQRRLVGLTALPVRFKLSLSACLVSGIVIRPNIGLAHLSGDCRYLSEGLAKPSTSTGR